MSILLHKLRKRRNACRAIVFLVIAMLAQTTLAEEILPAYSTYRSAPFTIGNQGLAEDVVDYLNLKLAGKYRFQLNHVPRERLRRLLEQEPNFAGVVLFLNPAFINDPEKTKYYWTSPFMADQNVVVSSISRRIDYLGPDSLAGMRFAAILGNRYAGLEERFGKDIERENANEEITNIKKVAVGRADATIMPSITYRYLSRQLGADNPLIKSLYISKYPHAQFNRFMFVSKQNVALGKTLDKTIAGMKTDPAWQAIVKKYHLE